MITRQIEIEELIKILPEAIAYLSDKGIRCLRCGEPVWGTLENASKEKGFNDEQISEFEAELNRKLMCKSI
ncbi:MAG: hypothetical protein FD122_1448 [Stygiobacter sp.]|nr:MAG: hypothetical protein FD122_1448 [Stygiobacter sp.]KAF0217482.1 MAG: hypothetical protein FD178_526 [Ignavibacteria bacterium]